RAPCLKTYFTSFDARLPCTMEYRVRRHDGQWRWVLDRGMPLYEEDRTFAGYIGSCIDITDRRQAEDALREREERLRNILSTVEDAIITIDRHGIIVGVNAATERIFGYPQDDLLGRNIKLLTPHAYDENTRRRGKYLEAAQASISGVPLETVGLRKNSSEFPMELSLTEIPQLGLFTVICRDITARKQTEQQLEQYRNDLRTMASELMLTEERERQRMAEDLHDGVGQAIFRARMKLDKLSTTEPAARELGTILQELGTMMNTMTFELSPPV